MKGTFAFFVLLLLFFNPVDGQKIKYSKENIKTTYPDAMQLIANVAGAHHFLCFSEGKKPLLSIFDPQLKLAEEKEIAIKIYGNTDIKLVPFEEFYFLYLHTPGKEQHQLWKIDGRGNTIPLSAALQQVIAAEVKNRTASLQLEKEEGKLTFLAHSYFEDLKKVVTTIVQVDENLQIIHKRKVFFGFNRDAENLQQVKLTRNSLLVLKSGKNDIGENTLELVKAGFDSSHTLIKTYNSTSYHYFSPSFRYNSTDSTFVVYSLLRELRNGTASQSTVLISKLDNQLHEKGPIQLLKSQFRNNTIANFLLLEGSVPQWVSMQIGGRYRVRDYGNVNGNNSLSEGENLSLRTTRTTSLVDVSQQSNTAQLRFTILNEGLSVKKDSLVSLQTKLAEINPRSFAAFTLNNTGYLVLPQQFYAKRKGLLLLHKKKDESLMIADLPVYDKYEYMLPLLQPVKSGYFILPYTNKKEIGLVRIDLE